MKYYNCLISNPWPEIKWGEKDRPAILIDGQLYELKSLSGTTITGQCAYIVGVNDKSIETICNSLDVEALQFYDMRVSDLSPIKNIPNLKQLAIRWNTKALNIVPIGDVESLETLILEDTPKIESLEPLNMLHNLKHFEFSGGIWSKNSSESLVPLASLNKLQTMTLLNLKISDDSLRPIAELKSLKELHLSNQFPTEEYAYLASNMPNTKCDMFSPYVRLASPIDDKDVMVVGRRKPFINSKIDKKKLQRYEDNFNELKKKFAINN